MSETHAQDELIETVWKQLAEFVEPKGRMSVGRSAYEDELNAKAVLGAALQADPEYPAVPCPRCHGEGGWIEIAPGSGPEPEEMSVFCPDCRGTGKIAAPPPEYLSGQEAVPVTKRKHRYTVNLTDEEMDALEALAKEHDLPPWRVLLLGLRLYQLNAHPVDLGPMLPPELAAPDLKAGKAEVTDEALHEVLTRIVKCDDDAKAAHGLAGAGLNGVGLVDLFDHVGHPFGVGEHKQQPYRSVELDVALIDARAALNPGASKTGEDDATTV